MKRAVVLVMFACAHPPPPLGPAIEPADSAWKVATQEHGGFHAEFPGAPQVIDMVIGAHAHGYSLSLYADGVDYAAMCVYFDDRSVPPLDAPPGMSRPIDVGGLDGVEVAAATGPYRVVAGPGVRCFASVAIHDNAVSPGAARRFLDSFAPTE
jgi:hypothetical protein